MADENDFENKRVLHVSDVYRSRLGLDPIAERVEYCLCDEVEGDVPNCPYHPPIKQVVEK